MYTFHQIKKKIIKKKAHHYLHITLALDRQELQELHCSRPLGAALGFGVRDVVFNLARKIAAAAVIVIAVVLCSSLFKVVVVARILVCHSVGYRPCFRL